MLELPTKLRGDLLCFADMGGDPRSLLCGSGVSYETVLARQPISQFKMAELFDRVAERAPDDFALTCGREIRLHYLGLLGYRLSNCETIGELLDTWTRYSINIGYPLASRFERGEDGWRMGFRARYPLSRRAYDFCVASTLAGFTHALFNLSGHAMRLSAIGFSFPAPSDMAKYAALDTERVLFDCAEPYVAGPRHDLDRRLATADAELRIMCDDLCRKLWTRAQVPAALADRLMELFDADGRLDLQGAANALGMSARSIQRRLAIEGTSFHDLLDGFRRERALPMVRQQKPGKVIAFDLGFADAGSFRRSFRRWTGMSCSEWQRAHQTGGKALIDPGMPRA